MDEAGWSNNGRRGKDRGRQRRRSASAPSNCIGRAYTVAVVSVFTAPEGRRCVAGGGGGPVVYAVAPTGGGAAISARSLAVYSFIAVVLSTGDTLTQPNTDFIKDEVSTSDLRFSFLRFPASVGR